MEGAHDIKWPSKALFIYPLNIFMELKLIPTWLYHTNAYLPHMVKIHHFVNAKMTYFKIEKVV